MTRVLIDAMTERAYEEVALAPENSYSAFVDKVDKQLAGAFNPSMAASTRPYNKQEIESLRWRQFRSHQKRLRRAILYYGHLLVFRKFLGWLKPQIRERLDRRLRLLYRAIFR